MTAAVTIRDFADLPPAEVEAFFASLTAAERAAKFYDWRFWARPEQLLPDGDWIYWLILAGRGFGKTRTGAEAVRYWIKQGFDLVNLIGATHDDLRAVMIEGESGLLATCPKSDRPRYVANARELRWPNGAKSLVFSAEEPDRLRGKQHMKLWADELAAWRYADAWDQAMFGLRLGAKPQAVITTTPRPTKIIKELAKDERAFVTRGSTFDNLANLADAFLHKIVAKYEGTRLGRQELNAEILEDVLGALFSRENIDANRRNPPVEWRPFKPWHPPGLRRIVVSIDPAVSTGEDADETGIIVVGCDGQNPPHGYVLEDASGIYAPAEWARIAVRLYRRHEANAIVGEINQGGDMVENTIRQFDPNVLFKAVRATRGKVLRAEPISGLYEQERIHHVGTFAKLEDQLCAFTSDFDRDAAGYSPDRLDAMVHGFTELFGINDDGIIHYYKGLVEERAVAKAKDAAPALPGDMVRLRCPEGVTTAYGMLGDRYTADADGTVAVKPQDAKALRGAGFVEIAGDP